jgi:hypothetical protein
MGFSTVVLSQTTTENLSTANGGDDRLTESVSLNFAKVTTDFPVTASDIGTFSTQATGNINFAAASVANNPASPTVSCTGNCFETTPTRLMQMNPGDSATFSAAGSTVKFTPTSTPDVVSVEWFQDCAPSVVDYAKGQFSVPEPGTLALLGAGLLGVMLRRRKTT